MLRTLFPVTDSGKPYVGPPVPNARVDSSSMMPARDVKSIHLRTESTPESVRCIMRTQNMSWDGKYVVHYGLCKPSFKRPLGQIRP